MQLVIAEKPSVARDLARVLGVRPAGKSAFEGPGRVITWCIGHLVELDEPAAYDARWKAWRLDTLPMVPTAFKLRPVPGTRDQLRAVRDLLVDRRFLEVVNACDAGREGELIFRYVYELAGARLPVRRLWISSLTDEAIRHGFAALRPGTELEPLADAARCRSEADWLVGLNATRAVTVKHRTGPGGVLYSIGRVQTPTLAIIVERDRAIRQFVPRDYFEVKGTFTTADGATLPATWTPGKVTRLGARPLADDLVARDGAHAGAADPHGPVVERVQGKRTREPPPLLFDLTSLQRTANRRYGMSANQTLEAAQALYERHKVLTYPRTDARHLSTDMAGELPRLFRALAALPDYAPFAEPLLAETPKPGKRVFDDARVSDHHAIVPTGKAVSLEALTRDERRIFDLVARRFLGAFMPDAEFALTEIIVRVGPGDAPIPKSETRPDGADEAVLEALPPLPDRYLARGRVRLVPGWQLVAGFGDDGGGKRGGKAGDEPEAPSLPAVSEGQRLAGSFEAVAKQTRPPPRHTEASLLSAMELAGRQIDDEELRAAMRDTGLGTPATRASIIETLLRRGFVAREGKQLVATEMGTALIEALPVASLASPELTGSWEARLARIARGEETRPAFMQDIARYVREAVAAIRAAPSNRVMASAAPEGARRPAVASNASASKGREPHQRPAAPKPGRRAPAPRPSPAASAGPIPCPRCRQGTLIEGKRGWGCSRWREGCALVIWFELAGKRLTDAQLRELVARGKTRKVRWNDGASGRAVLDLDAARERGAARFEPA